MKNKFLDDFDVNGKESIISLLANEILGKEQAHFITQRYIDLANNFEAYTVDGHRGDSTKRLYEFSEGLTPFKGYSDTTSVPIPITHPLFSKLRNKYLQKNENAKGAVVGFDMPTWFNLGNATSRLMIVAQDPLRNPQWYRDCKDAVYSTTFGLHSIEWRENGRGGKRLAMLTQKLSENGYGVYLTDILKFYVRDTDHKPLKADENVLAAYRKILIHEIEIVRPNAIIALGKQAQKALALMGLDFKPIELPHFSGSAQGAIKNYFCLEDKKLTVELQVQLYFDEIISQLNG